MNSVLQLVGLAKKAGRVELGEDAVGAAAGAHGARLILLAGDAAQGTSSRAWRYADEGACLLARLPAVKSELGNAVGRASCAVLAITDIGFADAIAQKLAVLDEARYGELAQRLAVKAARAAERKRVRSCRKQMRSGRRGPAGQ